MPKRHDDLYHPIANFQALHAAARRALRGKRKKSGGPVTSGTGTNAKCRRVRCMVAIGGKTDLARTSQNRRS